MTVFRRNQRPFARRLLAIVFLVIAWVFSGWPQTGHIPVLSPRIQSALASSGDVILLWDTANGAVPAGWTCISCTGGDAFFGVFPRAAAAYSGSTAGSDTHTHTLTYSSATAGGSDTAQGTNASNKALLDSHTHTWGNITSGSGDVRPPYQDLEFIYANSPSVIPANAIAIFDGSLPAGWTRYSALDGLYLRGGADDATGGAATHTHTIAANSITSGSASKLLSDSGSGGTACTAVSHTLPAANTDLTAAANAPQYLDVIFAYNSSGGDASIPTGLIAFFDATPTGNWTVVSDSAPWTNSFLVGAASYGGTGGSNADHNHGGSVVLTSSQCSTRLTNLGTTGTSVGALYQHTHDVTYTIDSQGSLPLYRDVILSKYSPSGSAPTVTTDSAQSFTPTSATVFGDITNDGGETGAGTDYGFAVSLDSALLTGVSTTSLGTYAGTGSFNYSSTTLSADQTYYFRAYASNSVGVGFGDIKSFTTGDNTPARMLRLFEGFIIKLISGTIKLFGR